LVEQNRERIVLFVPAPPPPPPAPEPPRHAAPPPTPPTPSPHDLRFSYALGLSLRGLDAPWPTYGALQLVRFGLANLPLDLAVEGSVTWPQRISTSDASANVWGFRAGGGACPRLGQGWLRPLTCLTVIVGRQYAEGRGLDVNRSGSATTVTTVLRAGAEMRLRDALELGVALRGEFALLRADLVTGSASDPRVLFRGAPVGLGADLWIGVALGSP
jgi:hypothetical protein